MIEKFDISQLDDIMTIWLDTNISAHSFVATEYWQKNYDLVKKLMPMSDMYVWLEDNKVSGFIAVTEREYIAGLFVKGDQQSKGIGRKLLAHAKEIYSRLTLDVYAKNQGAVSFYTNNGFSVESEKISENDGEKEYHMVWQTNNYSIY